MDLTRVAAVIPAGGSGELVGKPKILNILPNKQSILGQVLTTIREAGLQTIVVVVNHYRFQEQIQLHLREIGLDNHVIFARQPWRLGAANAVAIGLEKLPDEIESVLVIYADMPMWQPETIIKLIDIQQQEKAELAMVSVALSDSTPETIARYGRVMRNIDGEILGIFEPDDVIEHQQEVTTVNPSLYVFDRTWLDRNLSRIPLTKKTDGFPDEFYLPRLVGIAHNDGVKVVEFPLEDHDEALGVNTLDDLDLVKQSFKRRLAKSQKQ